ncbi:response regulator transcription factor [Denitratisoma sp. agr-D3]
MFDRSLSRIVLIVDDVPENLAVLHDALDEAGYTVLVATNGEDALDRARQSLPDVILLDALMPGLDGFETARRLKAQVETQPIPIVFMTGLTDTEHVVAGFQAGGVDYVTKPIRPPEVIARIEAHVHSTRLMRQAASALDAFGQAVMAVNAEGRIVWRTPLARRLLTDYFGQDQDMAPTPLLDWLRGDSRGLPYTLAQDGKRLTLSLHRITPEQEWLLALQEEDNAATIAALIQAFALTQKEAEVLYWVVQGKTSRDIGDILGSSPRTVNKHLEHVFEKLGVETRTAAANLAQSKLRGKSP